jgi:hypothetical protein
MALTPIPPIVNQVQYGVTPNSISGGDVTVTFPTPFSGVPRVVATANNALAGANISVVNITGVTATGFTFCIVKSDNVRIADKNATWIAVL